LRLIGVGRNPAPVSTLQATGLEISREMVSLRINGDLAHLAAPPAGYGIAVSLRRAAGDLTGLHEDLRAVHDHLAKGLTAYLATSR
jgi:hypothetical protein